MLEKYEYVIIIATIIDKRYINEKIQEVLY